MISSEGYRGLRMSNCNGYEYQEEEEEEERNSCALEATGVRFKASQPLRRMFGAT